MGDSGYKGVSADQDSRFKNKEAALLKSIKFPSNFDHKVDMRKVELSVIKPWAAQRITELLGFEDDVVLEYAAGMLEEERHPDPRKMQISLTGFLESQTATFMSELWTLLLSAQDSPGGIPAIFVQRKKEEMQKRKEEEERMLREARKKQDLDRWREPPRRSAPSGRSRWDSGPRGFKDKQGNTTERVRDEGWGNRAASRRRSPSPPPRRRSPSPPRRSDNHRHRGYRRDDERRSRSTSRSRSRERRRRRSPSRSVTPDYRGSSRNDTSDSPPRPARDVESDRRREQELRDRLLRAKVSSTPLRNPLSSWSTSR